MSDEPKKPADQTPLETAVRKFNSGVADIANAVYSTPDAIARKVSGALHGDDAVQKAAGEFDPQPLNTMVERFATKPNGHNGRGGR